MEAVGICQPQAQTGARKKTKKPKYDSTSLTTENPWQGYPGTVKALKVYLKLLDVCKTKTAL